MAFILCAYKSACIFINVPIFSLYENTHHNPWARKWRLYAA